jgi:hypothetical protein
MRRVSFLAALLSVTLAAAFVFDSTQHRTSALTPAGVSILRWEPAHIDTAHTLTRDVALRGAQSRPLDLRPWSSSVRATRRDQGDVADWTSRS